MPQWRALLLAQDRTNSAQNVSDERRGKSRRVRLHRTLLQREASSLDDWISEPYGVRDQGWISLSGCHPNRVQANAANSNREFEELLKRHLASVRPLYEAAGVE